MADLAAVEPSTDTADDAPSAPSITLTPEQAEAAGFNDVMAGEEYTITAKAKVSLVGGMEGAQASGTPEVTLELSDITAESDETEAEPTEPAGRPMPKRMGPKEAGIATAGEEE